VTIGKKIKYLRELTGLTQSQLAYATGLHPVSIRKYETNKTQPQLPQIEKIAAALNISPNALIGLENSNLKLETVGDFMSILFMLLETKQIKIKGERNENGFLKPDNLSLYVNNPIILSQLINWEKIDNLNNQALFQKGDTPDDVFKAVLDRMQEIKEKVTIETQRSMIILTPKDTDKSLDK
jgi:transcriptional regulator with XRE-family HTH domain